MPASVPPAPTVDLAAIAAAFPLPGDFHAGAPHGNGHINDTYAITQAAGDRRVRYILQRINGRVFPDIAGLMENVARVTAHVARCGAAPAGPTRPSLRLVPARDGQPWHRDDTGGWWRCYDFIEGARTHDRAETPALAAAAARAFGEFQRQLVSLPGPRLHETIPGFHDTRRRFGRLQEAIAADPENRAAGARAEIALALAGEPLVDRLADLHRRGAIPERVVHNDTKLNNVMIDEATGRAACVIDLDTVMPGLAPHDFGDLVRSATNAAAEDERDLARVSARLPVFAALADGYLGAARDFLQPAEVDHLVLAGQLMTFEVAIRFLTDHLAGDVYFKIHRPGHNLERARAQFALLRSLQAQEEAMEREVRRALHA